MKTRFPIDQMLRLSIESGYQITYIKKLIRDGLTPDEVVERGRRRHSEPRTMPGGARELAQAIGASESHTRRLLREGLTADEIAQRYRERSKVATNKRRHGTAMGRPTNQVGGFDSAADLASHAGLSVSHVRRLLRQGMSPDEVLNRGREPLKRGPKPQPVGKYRSVSTICRMSGVSERRVRRLLQLGIDPEEIVTRSWPSDPRDPTSPRPQPLPPIEDEDGNPTACDYVLPPWFQD